MAVYLAENQTVGVRPIIVYYAKWQHRQKYNYIHKIQKYIHKTEHKNRLRAKITVHTLLKNRCVHKMSP